MIYKNSPSSSTFLKLDEGSAILASGPISVSSVKDAGVFINGPVSISSGIHNFKMGGIYRFNPMLATGIPSTLATPMPVFKLDLPVPNMSQFIAIAGLASSIGV